MDRRALMTAGAALMLAPGAALGRGPGRGPGRENASSGWRVRAPMPEAIQEIYAAHWGELIVTAGGLDARPDGLRISDRTAIYDTVREAWSDGPPLPEPRHHPMIVVSDGRPYALGGYGRGPNGDWTSSTDVWVLDGEWVAAGRMPAPQAETVGVDHAGLIHLIGGRAPDGPADGQWGDHGDIAAHRVLNPRDNRWSEARPLPLARNSAAACVMDGAIWVAGGRTVRGGGVGRLDRYDPIHDRWDALAPIPRSPRSGEQVGGGLAMAAAGGRLWAFGGEWFAPGGGGVFAETWAYDPARDLWEEGPPMTTPRHGLAGVAVGRAIYAIGGGEVVGGGRASAVVEALFPQDPRRQPGGGSEGSPSSSFRAAAWRAMRRRQRRA